MAKTFTCPQCGSPRLRRSRRKDRGIINFILRRHLFRCDSCRHTFRSTTVRWRYIIYAKCPHCLSLKLTDWEEKYYLPPRRKRMLIYIGARQARCEACRKNFVTFRLRWKPKKNGSK